MVVVVMMMMTEWEHGGKVWTGCIRLRVGTSGGVLWTR